jgi:hypothetical protein
MVKPKTTRDPSVDGASLDGTSVVTPSVDGVASLSLLQAAPRMRIAVEKMIVRNFIRRTLTTAHSTIPERSQ